MKILLTSDINYEFICGSNRFVKNLAHWLKKKGHTVLMVTPSPSGKNAYYEYEGMKIYGVSAIPSFVQKTLRLSPFSFFLKRSLQKVVEDFQPDVIHIQSHFFNPYVLVRIAEQMGIPTVGTNHFVPENVVPIVRIPKVLTRTIEKLLWRHLHWVFGKVGVVTTPTETAAAILRGSGFRKKVQVISNGIDLSRYFADRESGEYLKKRYHLPDKKILLFVGRLDPEKHIDVVIRALPAALKKMDMHFVVAGRGAQAKVLKMLAAELGVSEHVTFTDFVPDEDLPFLYRIADAFVNAGTAELQCIAMMEAMATSLPVIAVDAMALHELVLEGENGTLFAPGDSAGLAEQIVSLFSDPQKMARMGKRSRELVEVHDIQNVITAFETLYQEGFGKMAKRGIKGADETRS